MLNLKIIIGSTRPGRAADRVIPWITALSGQHGAFRAKAAARVTYSGGIAGGVLPPAIRRMAAAAEGHRR